MAHREFEIGVAVGPDGQHRRREVLIVKAHGADLGRQQGHGLSKWVLEAGNTDLPLYQRLQRVSSRSTCFLSTLQRLSDHMVKDVVMQAAVEGSNRVSLHPTVAHLPSLIVPPRANGEPFDPPDPDGKLGRITFKAR